MKFSVLAKVFITLVTVLLIVQGQCKRRKYRRKNSNDFDLFIFTQHWPLTVCYAWKEKYETHTCNLPTNEEWTIHGIWPTQIGKIGPEYCNNASHFDSILLLPIKEELQTKWMNIEGGTAQFSLWKHEWEKHGTCAMVIEDVNNELKYFKKGLELLDKYGMSYILPKANILPNRSYKVQDILNSIKKILGKSPAIECFVDDKYKTAYLFEIRICFDKSFNLIDCNGIVNFPTDCSHKRNITYPSSVSNYIRVIQI